MQSTSMYTQDVVTHRWNFLYMQQFSFCSMYTILPKTSIFWLFVQIRLIFSVNFLAVPRWSCQNLATKLYILFYYCFAECDTDNCDWMNSLLNLKLVFENLADMGKEQVKWQGRQCQLPAMCLQQRGQCPRFVELWIRVSSKHQKQVCWKRRPKQLWVDGQSELRCAFASAKFQGRSWGSALNYIC